MAFTLLFLPENIIGWFQLKLMNGSCTLHILGPGVWATYSVIFSNYTNEKDGDLLETQLKNAAKIEIASSVFF